MTRGLRRLLAQEARRRWWSWSAAAAVLVVATWIARYGIDPPGGWHAFLYPMLGPAIAWALQLARPARDRAWTLPLSAAELGIAEWWFEIGLPGIVLSAAILCEGLALSVVGIAAESIWPWLGVIWGVLGMEALTKAPYPLFARTVALLFIIVVVLVLAAWVMITETLTFLAASLIFAVLGVPFIIDSYRRCAPPAPHGRARSTAAVASLSDDLLFPAVFRWVLLSASPVALVLGVIALTLAAIAMGLFICSGLATAARVGHLITIFHVGGQPRRLPMPSTVEAAAGALR